jgi:hypothetical protein
MDSKCKAEFYKYKIKKAKTIGAGCLYFESFSPLPDQLESA